MVRWLPFGLLMIGLAIVGCNRGNQNPPKINPDKPEAKGDKGEPRPKDQKDGAKDRKDAVDGDKEIKAAQDGKKKHDDKKEKKEPNAAGLKPDFERSPQELIREFIADKKAAAAKYEDKTVEVIGMVYDVDSKGLVQVQEDEAKKGKDPVGGSVNARVRSEDLYAAGRLSKGQKVKFIGTYNLSGPTNRVSSSSD